MQMSLCSMLEILERNVQDWFGYIMLSEYQKAMVCGTARPERSKCPWHMSFIPSRCSAPRTSLGMKYKGHQAGFFYYFRISFFILNFCSCIYYIYLYNKQQTQPFFITNKKREDLFEYSLVCILMSLALCKYYVLDVHLSLAMWTVFCKCVSFSSGSTHGCVNVIEKE